MKILTVDQIRQADKATIANEPIPSIDLMERAASAFTKKFKNLFNADDFTPEQPVQIFCGIGNNGGDGLAIARMLLNKNYPVEVYVTDIGKGFSEDFQVNYERLTADHQVYTIQDKASIPAIKSGGIVIDAIFGSGLSRPAEGLFAQIIEAINSANSRVVAVDISSGLFADKPMEDQQEKVGEGNLPAVIKANYTFSFQLPKLAFMLPQNEIYVGKWFLLDIGLDRDFIDQAPAGYYYQEARDVKNLLKARKKYAHKGNFGKIYIIAGGYGKMGAAVLSLTAAMRSGAGLVTAHIPGCGYSIVQTSIPEVMVDADVDEYSFTRLGMGKKDEEIHKNLAAYDALGLGPGLGTENATKNALGELFDHLNKMDNPPRLVLDADGLNMCSQEEGLLKAIPNGSVLTPHPGEFERLAGKSANNYQRLEMLKEFAFEKSLYVVLKGGNTAIASPQGIVYFNSTGNPGMASGGSGDLLTGLLTSLLGQQYDTLHAAILGVFIHGLAGDFAARNLGEEGMIASDIIGNLPYAFQHLHQLR